MPVSTTSAILIFLQQLWGSATCKLPFKYHYWVLQRVLNLLGSMARCDSLAVKRLVQCPSTMMSAFWNPCLYWGKDRKEFCQICDVWETTCLFNILKHMVETLATPRFPFSMQLVETTGHLLKIVIFFFCSLCACLSHQRKILKLF